MNRIPSDCLWGAEELTTAKEDGAVQFSHINMGYVSAVPSVCFIIYDEVTASISPSAQAMLDPLNKESFQFPVTLRMKALPDSGPPEPAYLVNAVNLLLNSGLVGANVFAIDGQLPELSIVLDKDSWHESQKGSEADEDGKKFFTLFGFVSLTPSRELLLQHISHQVMVGASLSRAVDEGQTAVKGAAANIAQQIMSGKLH